MSETTLIILSVVLAVVVVAALAAAQWARFLAGSGPLRFYRPALLST